MMIYEEWRKKEKRVLGGRQCGSQNETGTGRRQCVLHSLGLVQQVKVKEKKVWVQDGCWRQMISFSGRRLG